MDRRKPKPAMVAYDPATTEDRIRVLLSVDDRPCVLAAERGFEQFWTRAVHELKPVHEARIR